MVVQTDFPDGLHLGVISAKTAVLPQGFFIHLVRRVRVGPNGGEKIIVLICQPDRFPGGSQAAPRIHHQGDAFLRQPVKKLCPVFVKGPVVQMGVGIKNHGK